MSDAELRRHLLERGATPAQLEGRPGRDLIALAGDLRLSAGFDLSLEEAASRSGLTLEAARSVYGHLGLDPDALAGFGEGDVALLRLVAADDAGLVEEVGDELLRVAGTALHRIADATVAAYVQDVENDPRRDGSDLVALARLNEYASGLVVDFARVLETMFRHHMWVAVHEQRSGQSDVVAPELIRTGIGFVDLVGFTPISAGLSPSDLMGLLGEFEHRAFHLARERGGRIVKSIGDEVMITGPDHATVAAIATALVGEFGDDPSTRPRGGVSYGQVVFRLGDFYGPVVNVAARLAAIAEPGEVLTDVGDPATAGVDLRPVGRRELKGVPEPVEVWSVGDGGPAAPPG